VVLFQVVDSIADVVNARLVNLLLDRYQLRTHLLVGSIAGDNS